MKKQKHKKDTDDTPQPDIYPVESIISQTYSPTPLNGCAPDHISPVDLWDFCNSFCTTTKDDITQVMSNMGFRFTNVEGEGYWLVYNIA